MDTRLNLSHRGFLLSIMTCSKFAKLFKPANKHVTTEEITSYEYIHHMSIYFWGLFFCLNWLKPNPTEAEMVSSVFLFLLHPTSVSITKGLVIWSWNLFNTNKLFVRKEKKQKKRKHNNGRRCKSWLSQFPVSSKSTGSKDIPDRATPSDVILANSTLDVGLQTWKCFIESSRILHYYVLFFTSPVHCPLAKW